MKVAAYIRVSTQMQVEDGFSLAAQKARLEAFAYSQGWEIIQYYVDEGISAKDMNRPELQRMLQGIKEGLFDIVLVYKLDRLTRSVVDLDKLLKEFSKHNVMFKSSTEVYDTTTATGRLFIRLVASMAEWERENLAERVKMGMLQKAQEGKWVMSIAPFGYELDGKDSLKINPTEASIVKEIYSLYTKGLGMHKIAKSLNDRGLYTKKDKAWSQGTISYVLSNPIYIGTMRYNYRINNEQYFEIDDAVPGIIPEEEFNTVQQIITSRKQVHPRQATSKHIFSKVLKCARCGKTLIGKYNSTKRGEKVYYSYNYICPNKRLGMCTMPAINQNLFEEKFLSVLDNINLKEEAKELSESFANQEETDYTETLKELEKERKEIDKRRSKWQYAWVNEMISDVDFKRRMKEEEGKEKMILKELENLKPKESSTTNVNIIDLWADVKLQWQYMTIEEKKQFVLLAIDYMVIDRVSMKKSPDDYVIQEVSFN